MRPFSIFFFLLLTWGWAYGEENAAEIVQKAVHRDQELQERRRQYDYDLSETVEKIGSDGVVKSRQTQKSMVLSDRRPDYATRPDKPSHEPAFDLLKILDHFTYTVRGHKTVHGVECYEVAYVPKPDAPYRNREEKVSNALSGLLWISTKDFSLMRNEGNLLHPVSVGWIFATLKKLDFHYESQLLPNGDWGPQEIRYQYQVEIPFAAIRERHIRAMTDYRPHAQS